MTPTIPAPFCVLVDTAEGHPFTFQGLNAREAEKPSKLKHQRVHVQVPSKFQCLGRHPHSLGDYSATGLVGIAHVERKSAEDAWGTILGWETPSEREKHKVGRRDRFKKELDNLSKIERPAVVVECTFDELVAKVPSWGKKTNLNNARTIESSVIAFAQDYPVPWFFFNGRRRAEVFTYRWLARAWRKLEGAK